jgi:hypothetical protein
MEDSFEVKFYGQYGQKPWLIGSTEYLESCGHLTGI